MMLLTLIICFPFSWLLIFPVTSWVIFGTRLTEQFQDSLTCWSCELYWDWLLWARYVYLYIQSHLIAHDRSNIWRAEGRTVLCQSFSRFILFYFLVCSYFPQFLHGSLEVWVCSLCSSTVLCSSTRHFPLIVTQDYEWVPANFQGNLMKCHTDS